ncbi:glycoside hydrolase family 73 protein [Companilactobacillus ginsenosidimutans]|uniref:Mannosyl-glycoprotein endo-beta-N-acetylglucosamidase-like domain-containing protein n=1 Tax=Companilactobacillus ginsenosidimutans TaxID=1007676 RepID=A0A0H4QJM4_9LACO|nr:glucosaminidase domain-containing protein [Companilactobacillus ginsenosidimutans]AKP67241.1 hypothetical protein ABM34_06610 [Companilactobacillus ginsenosidimutans]
MNKKWVVSTAFASFLAAVGISTTTSHVRATVSANDKDETDNDADQQDMSTTGAIKDPTVASVMDAQGAPVTESTPVDETNTTESSDVTQSDASQNASDTSKDTSTDSTQTDATQSRTDEFAASEVQGVSVAPGQAESDNTSESSQSAATQSSAADPATEASSSADTAVATAASDSSAQAADASSTSNTDTGSTVKTAPGFTSEVQAAIAASPETNSQVLPTNDGTVLERSATSDGSVTQAATNSQQDEFLAMAAPMAQKAASEYGLYASVMLAQSILESGWGQSDLALDANNLFGIKGDYNGAYVSMPTSEWSADQGWYQIYANFRKYPSFYESFQDNGDKLRNGLAWDSSYYSGTWVENTSSYKDATAWLQGRYATAPNYAASLNSIIETYNLTQYDTDSESNPNLTDNNNSTDTGNETNVNGVQTKIDDAAVVTNLENAQIYDNANINTPSARALGYGTAWKAISKVVDPSGNVFYQVSTNEYVLSTDVQLQSEGGTETEPPVSINDTVLVTGDTGATVYSAANMKSPTSKILPYSSEWKTTAYVTDNDGNTFFYVGTDAYVLASDVVQKSKITNDDYVNDVTVSYPDILKVITAPSAKLYDTKHNLLSTSLTNGTNWRTDKKSTHADGSVWYRVSNDQWVNASDVQVLGSNYITSVKGTVKINYIPGYGISVYNSPAVNNKFIGTRLADGTTWKVTSKQIVDGETWYEVPAGWVNGKYCLFTPLN